MTFIIDLLYGYEITNLTSIIIEIFVGLAIGIAIYGFDNKSKKRQEEMIKQIKVYADRQKKNDEMIALSPLVSIGFSLLKLDELNELSKRRTYVEFDPDTKLTDKNKTKEYFDLLSKDILENTFKISPFN